MALQIWEQKEKGYATRIVAAEAGKECQGCQNLFSVGEKVYMMHKENGTTIMCTSQSCFVKQGGVIDEYQVNTTVTRKIKPVVQKHEQQSNFQAEIVKNYREVSEIEKILIGENPDFKTNVQKLGMYIKVIDLRMALSKLS